MFNRDFSHYISYGSTDQLTLRELSSTFNGLLVPGTVAAFQRDGTGGFVLSLSATQANPDYVIDPRFPLFQQALPTKKKSHTALAKILGDVDLVTPDMPKPLHFGPDRIELIAKQWAAFNLGYESKSKAKFAKYAKRLDEDVIPDNANNPLLVLAPYFVCKDIESPWWEISKSLFLKTSEAVNNALPTKRVVATESPSSLLSLLSDVADDECAIWVSDLHEVNDDAAKLGSYLNAINSATKSGKKLFSLYGGFFSVLASSVGLHGSSHGIGFGEHRSWRELPKSGPPPARYYVPKIHRYVRPEEAFQMWREDKNLVGCNCPECEGKSPIELEYHELMKHSAYCREYEILQWYKMSTTEALYALKIEKQDFEARLSSTVIPNRMKEILFSKSTHLDRWVQALQIYLSNIETVSLN